MMAGWCSFGWLSDVRRTSVRQDVYAHVSSQGVVAEHPSWRLEGSMPC